MKVLMCLCFVLTTFHLLCNVDVCADPRMETNKNFCHFIIDPLYPDNEVFVADCGSVITTVERSVDAEIVKNKCNETNYLATGFAMVNLLMQQSTAPVSPGSALTITSNESNVPCTMVESNGRTYTSHNWQSTISVGRAKKKGYIKVHYELSCMDGE